MDGAAGPPLAARRLLAALLPWPSVAVHCTVVAPMANVLPAAGVKAFQRLCRSRPMVTGKENGPSV